MTAKVELKAESNPVVAPLLETSQLTVVYNHVQIGVQGVSIAVMPGKIVAILGANGAGKTTTLRAISGFLSVDNATIAGGQVLLDGQVISGKAPHTIANLGISLVAEREKIFTTLTVEENFRAVPQRGSAAERAQSMELIYELFPVLEERRRQVAGYMSGGERQMLAIALALLLQPRILSVDELSFGLAPMLVGKLMQALVRINQVKGTAILLVEQNAPAAMAVADYVYIIETGRIVLAGTPAQLMANPAVRESYLGISGNAGVRSYADVSQYRRKRRGG